MNSQCGSSRRGLSRVVVGRQQQQQPKRDIDSCWFVFAPFAGPRVDNFQTLDPRKQELLEARFLGMRSTSNPAGGSSGGGGGGGSGGNLLQATATLQQHQQQQPVVVAHSVPACNVMAAQAHQPMQPQQPSPSSLNASAAPQFTASYMNPTTNNHGELHHHPPSSPSTHTHTHQPKREEQKIDSYVHCGETGSCTESLTSTRYLSFPNIHTHTQQLGFELAAI